MPVPRCAKCESTNITYETAAIHGRNGFYVLCGACGAIITWVPNKVKTD
jgi:ribosomal protein S27E